MTLEEIKRANLKKGRPSADMSDKDWQTWFEMLKLSNKPSLDKRFSVKSERNNDNYSSQPETQWFRYKQFVNSVLSSIRHGEMDYCYYVDQIVDLLRFEPGIKTKYYPEDRCFEVWM